MLEKKIKRRYLQARRVHGFSDSLVLFNLICIEVDVLTLYLSFEIRETMNAILYLVALVLSGSHIVSCFSARDEIPFRFHEIFPARGAIQPGLRRPLHMSPVTGLTRLPGRILLYVHMRNLSPVHRDEFKKVGKVGLSVAKTEISITGQPGFSYEHINKCTKKRVGR